MRWPGIAQFHRFISCFAVAIAARGRVPFLAAIGIALLNVVSLVVRG